MAIDRRSGETHGLGIDLGKELAKRLGVRFEQVGFQRIAEVIEAMKTGDVDLTVSNATPARAVDVAFSQTLISIELGYLVAGRLPDRSDFGVGQARPSGRRHPGKHVARHHSKTPAECDGRAGPERQPCH